MANVKISDLTAMSGEIASTTLLEAELANGSSVKVTAAQFAEFIRDTMFAALVGAGAVTITQNDGSDTITISATSGGGGGSSGPGKMPDTAGRRYPVDRYARANAALVANTLYAIPFRNPIARTVLGLGLRLVTGAASTNARVAIYADVNGKPSDSGPIGGEVTFATTASAATATGTYGSGVALSADTVYWAVAVSDGTPTTVGIATTDQLLPWYIGYDEAFSGAGGAVGSYVGQAAYTYGALPTGTFPAMKTSSASGPLPYLVL